MNIAPEVLDELREYIDCTRADITLANYNGHLSTANHLTAALKTAERDLRKWTSLTDQGE